MPLPNTMYKEMQVRGANPLELVLLLYDGAITFLQSARQCIDQGDIEGRVNHINRASDIVSELRASLNFAEGKDVATGLNLFYLYINQRMVEANVRQSQTILDEVIHLLREVKASWMQVLTAQKNSTKESAQPLTTSIPYPISA